MARRPRKKFGATQNDRIFLALLPDAEAAARISARAEELKAAHVLGGTLTRPEHLHITLFHLGDWISLPEEIVRIASAAAAKVRAAPFEVRVDRAASFGNSTGIYPFVLLSESAGLFDFHAKLGAALTQEGLGGATKGEFKPHITLLRDETRAKAAKVAPIVWTARDFVLVHSLLGKTTHVHLGCWPLAAAS
ncbi:MAG: RNA 2',3'-cyclic phosphodiesterase [Proteobacteria bacterium]|nr:RNA 2',3'-cyclic phosphodiesterase [Pseudomonadota bacterium]